MRGPETFALLSALVVLIGAPPYLLDILKGRTKPQRMTWFIWTLQGTVAFVSQLKLGAHWSLVFTGLNAFGNLLVFLLALKFGVGGLKKLDITALVIAIVGVGVSIIIDEPLVALLGVIIADFAGLVPTLIKTYHLPKSETSITWFALGTAALLAIFSVDSWKWSLLIYPVYLMTANYAVLVSKYSSQYLQKRKN